MECATGVLPSCSKASARTNAVFSNQGNSLFAQNQLSNRICYNAPVGHEYVGHIDVDKNQSLAAKYQVKGVPTMLLFKNGKQVWRQSGVLQKNDIIKVIEPHLK